MFASDSRTIVDIDFASVASESSFTSALESISSSHTGGTVSAGVGGAGVRFECTVSTRVSYRAYANVACGARLADATVPAGLVKASQSSRLAPCPLISLWTRTRQFTGFVWYTRPSIATRSYVARVQRFLAIRTSVLGRTHTSVAPLPCIMARATIPTRPMVSAIVEVLVAEQPSPTLFTYAIPGPRAGAVYAARMSLAPVTHLAHPTRMTTGIKKKIR